MQLTVRNTVLVLLAAAALALAWFYLSAAKAEAGWDGLYFGGAVGYQNAISDTSFTEPPLTASIDSLAASGAAVTGIAGFDITPNKGPLVLGVWADWTKSDSEFAVSATGLGDVISTGVDTVWAVGGRAGYIVTPGAMIFVGAGYVQAELDDIALAPPVGTKPLAVPTLDGYRLLAGSEVSLGGGLHLQVQYSYDDFEKADIALGGGDVLGVDVDLHTARVGILYRLWGDEASAVAKEIEALAPASKPLK
jgi:opacity protein-like surface antigen